MKHKLKFRLKTAAKVFFGLLLVAAIPMALLSFQPAQILLSKLISDTTPHTLKTFSYGDHRRQKLDIYQPKTGTGNESEPRSGPIILFLYGGGWRQGSRQIYRFVGTALATRGITTIIPDYRLFPEVSFPAFIEDAAKAYHWVWKNFARGGPIIIMGHSAGAHSAAMIALNRDYLDTLETKTPRPAALIGISGPYSFDPTTWPSTKDIFATAPDADSARPVAHVSANAPPAFLLHGLKDTIVRLWNLETLAENYQKVGRPVTTKTYPGLGHIDIILTIARPLRWRAPVLDDITRFIAALPEPEQRMADR